MDQFDFSAPISATVFFDDSDDETFEKKLSIENFQTEKEESTKYSPKIEQDQDETKKPAENSQITPTRDISKNETCLLSKDNMENNTDCEQLKSVNSKKQEKQAIKAKPLDMPLLEENNNVDNDNIFIKKLNANEETEENNHIRYTHVSAIQKQRETLIKKKKVFKRKLTEELNISDKAKTANKISAENRESCTRDINLTDGNNIIEILKDSNVLNPTHDNYEIQKLGSSEVAEFLKNFVSCNQTLPNNTISQIESAKENIEADKTPLINIEINPTTLAIDQAQSNGDKSSQSLNEQKAADNYLKSLLNTVSQHMIYIFDSYQSYANLCDTGASPILIENAKNNYLASRRQFFDLSYSTVVNIIIPKNNEPSFVKNFLIDTMQIARSMSYNCSYKQTEAMYFDMMTWTQKRQTQIQNMNRVKKSNPMLAQELQKPCLISPITDQKDQGQKQSPRKKSKQSRFPHKSISQSSNLHKPTQQKQLLPNVQQLQNSTPQNKPPPYPNQNQQYVEHPLYESVQSHRFGHHNYIGSTSQNAYKHYYENQMLHTHPNQNIWLQKQRKQMTTNDQVQSMQNLITNIEPCANYNRQVQGSTLQQNRSQPWLNAINPTGQEQLPYIWKNNILPSYPQNYQQHCQETISSQNYHKLSLVMPPEMTTQVEVSRSSISRDSGFTESPLNFNTSNALSSQEEQRPQWSTTPLITHVTSLNPNVSLIKDGNCAVCGKVTKQKCLGCFNYYYCSHGCQFQDWQVHQLVCNKRCDDK